MDLTTFYTDTYHGSLTEGLAAYLARAENIISAVCADIPENAELLRYYELAVCAEADHIAECSESGERVISRETLGDYTCAYESSGNTGSDRGDIICREAMFYLDAAGMGCRSMNIRA